MTLLIRNAIFGVSASAKSVVNNYFRLHTNRYYSQTGRKLTKLSESLNTGKVEFRKVSISNDIRFRISIK